MTNQQILEEAIREAIKGGWNFDFVEVTSNPGGLMVMDNVGVKYTVNDIIFNHAFAKALWGEEIAQDLTAIEDKTDRAQWIKSLVPVWEYHLQQMVIADDPIAYLRDNLPQ